MNTQIIRGSEVTRPVPDALTSSVLDHASVDTNASWGLRNNAGLWPSYNCLDLLVPTTLCPDPMADTTKQFSNGEWTPAFEFAVYGGVQCALVGLDRADQEAETKRIFERSAGKGVEMALLANRFVATDSDAPVQWDAPTDLGAAPSLPAALAILEGHAAAHYAGVPTLHLPRAAVTFGFGLGLFEKVDGKFFTKTGAKVAAGGGYDDADGAQGGSMDLYATGEVYVEQSEQINVSAFVVPGDGSGLGSGENGLADNTYITLAERLFRVGIDCYSASVNATVWA